MKTPWMIMLASVALIGFLPGASADDTPYAYVSGECYDQSGTVGGSDAVGVNEEGEVMVLDPTPGSGGATDAAIEFAVKTAEGGGQTGTACAHNGYGGPGDSDHLQVRAGMGDVVVVVCYDGQANTEPSRCPAQGNK